MPKVFHCSKCASQHPRPVGKKCQYEGESLSGDLEVTAPPPQNQPVALDSATVGTFTGNSTF